MSITASTWAWQQELPSSRKMVLLDLAERHNGQTGHCFPSIATIAQRTGLSLRCVQGHLRALAARGLISIRARHRRSNLFVLHITASASVAETSPAAAPQPWQAAQIDPADFTGLQAAYPADDGAGLGFDPAADAPKPEVEDSNRKEEKRERAPAPLQSDFNQNLLGKEGKAPVHPEPACPDPAVSRRPEPDGRAVPAGLPVPAHAWGRTRGTPLPDDWNPSAGDREFARSRGLDPAEIILAFAAYYRANGAVRADWSAAWELWCLREPKFHRPERKTAAEIRDENARSALAGVLRGMARKGLGSVRL